MLTHDPKFDVPVLEVALRTPAGYIGAMGSRRTHEDRLERLRAIGMTEEELARLRSPIGLDLGARTPEETAVSIAAELIQLRGGGSGQALTSTEGRIHREEHVPASRGPATRRAQSWRRAQSSRRAQSLRPVNASRAPIAIMASPPVPPSMASRRGERDSHARTVPAARAQALSLSSATAAKIAPSTTICRGT